MNFKSFQESKTGTLKKLEKASALSASEKPEDQDRAREYRVSADFKSWRNQKRSGKLKEEVGISSAVKMKQAQEKAKRDLIQDKAVAKQKATFKGYSSDDMEKKKVKKEEVQFDEVYKKLPVAKMASKISKKQFKAGQSGDVKTISKKSTETGKMIGVLDTHDPERSKAKSKIKEATRYSKETGKNLKSGKPYVKGGTAKGDTVYKSVLAQIKQKYGANAVQQSSKEPKKVKGDKTRRQVGDRKFSPADTIAKRRAAKAAYIKSRSGD